MAKTTQVILTCDLDAEPAPAVGTFRFSFDGQAYEFELCQSHLDEFTKVMQGYADAARRTTGRPQPRRSTSTSSDLGAIREWARANGFKVSDRGRVSATIRDAYDAANQRA